MNKIVIPNLGKYGFPISPLQVQPKVELKPILPTAPKAVSLSPRIKLIGTILLVLTSLMMLYWLVLKPLFQTATSTETASTPETEERNPYLNVLEQEPPTVLANIPVEKITEYEYVESVKGYVHVAELSKVNS